MQTQTTPPHARCKNFRQQPRRVLSGILRALVCLAPVALLASAALAQEIESPFDVEMITGGGGTELAVYEAGNPDGAEIVFIHGLMGSHLAWISQLTGTLAQNYRLIAIDLRGHANSGKPLETEAYTASRYWAEDLHAVMEAKSLENPVLVGWSYGPRLIKDYIRYFGQHRLAGIVLVSTAPVMAGTDEEFALYGPGMLALFEELLSADDQVRLQATTEFLTDLLTAEPFDDATLDMVLDIAMLVPSEARAAMFSRLLDNSDIAADMTIPALLIHGESDQVVDPQASSDMAALIDDSALLTYPETGHAPFLETPERFDSDLSAFMQSLNDPLTGLSGSWHDPATEGQGWNFLAVENGLYGHFYGYGENGEPIWLITEEVVNDIETGTPVTYNLLKGTGGSFGNPVPPENLEHFGVLTLTFQNCEEATAEITSTLGNEIQYLERFATVRDINGCGLPERQKALE